MKESITPVIVRIVMRYLSAALVAWGVLAPEAGVALVSDPDLQAVLLIAVGSLVGLVTEYAYSRASDGWPDLMGKIGRGRGGRLSEAVRPRWG